MSELEDILAGRILEIADDELIIAHRNSEWCGHAPILEEDIAFANLALDEIGHAILWYQLYAKLKGLDPEEEPDKLVYFREPFEYRASQFVALPKGDWAFSMLRQYLWDVLEWERLEAYSQADYAPLVEVAKKIKTEEIYHLRHTEAWVIRLCLGTDESARRMQSALDLLWPYTGQLTGKSRREEELGVWGLPESDMIAEAWRERVTQLLVGSGLKIPKTGQLTLNRSLQSMHMIEILAEMQQVARLDPSADW